MRNSLHRSVSVFRVESKQPATVCAPGKMTLQNQNKLSRRHACFDALQIHRIGWASESPFERGNILWIPRQQELTQYADSMGFLHNCKSDPAPREKPSVRRYDAAVHFLPLNPRRVSGPRRGT